MIPKPGSPAIARGLPLAVAVLLIALSSPVLTGAAERGPLGLPSVLQGTARVKFDGRSTLHNFSGEVAAQPFMLYLASHTWSAESAVRTRELTTANAKRDRKMWEMFTSAKYPRIQGTIEQAIRPTNGVAQATLRLRIRGIEHDLPVQISQWTEDARAVSFHASWNVSLKAYGLKPPSVIGLIHVDDRVHVEADVAANAAPATAAAPPSGTIESKSKP